MPATHSKSATISALFSRFIYWFSASLYRWYDRWMNIWLITMCFMNHSCKLIAAIVYLVGFAFCFITSLILTYSDYQIAKEMAKVVSDMMNKFTLEMQKAKDNETQELNIDITEELL